MLNPWSKLTDAFLAQKAMSGDPKAFSAVYDRYSPLIYRHLLYRTPNKETAEDLLSRTFLKCWEYIKSGKKIVYLKQFLYTTAQNSLTDFYRRKNSSDVLSDDLTEYDRPDDADRAPVMLDREFDRERIQSALAKVKPEFRDVLVMRYLDELEIAEIAQTLDSTPNAVYVRIHRALKSLKQTLTENP